TVLAIVATGNHWVLDAVGGAAAVGAGFGLTHLLTGPRADPEKDGEKTGDGVPSADDLSRPTIDPKR
ncbi:hypothetical protein, partial [Streptomyces scabiei]